MRRLTLGLLLALALAAPALAGDRDRKRSIDARIEQLRGHLTEQRHQEDVLRGQVADVTGRIRTLEAEVGDVSLRLRTLEQDLALHEDRLKKLTQLFQLQTERYDALKGQHKLAVERLNNRLVDIYESDEVTSFDVLFGASSISDALDEFDYMRAVADQDERIAREVDRAKRQVKAARARTAQVRASVRQAARAIAVRTAQTREARDELVGATNDLASSKREKLQDLSQLTAEERAEVGEIDALQAQSAAIAAAIREAQARAAARAAAGAARGSSVAPAPPTSNGPLQWPVSGPVTSPFGWRWGRMHEGIDIAVGYGTPIGAAGAGTVIYCGWMGGYGNLIVIDHGGGLATAYGHQSSIAAGCGQAVSRGQIIGYVGSTGHSTGPHLHFEVRVNGAAVDPLGYL
ncbi:MAG TPA: peptidoglycan DD-metalloendopeptidase family protein [Gaiellaceae bacterium]|nr:peptidoglycan DD-metalloendopeptidase family protein [Gaiellaceae bacterium]